MGLVLAALLIAVVVQVVVVLRAQRQVTHAAAQAARTAMVQPTEAAVLEAVVQAAGLPADRVQVRLIGDRSPGGLLRVEVRYRCPTAVAPIGVLLDDVELTESFTVRVE
jgi:hypothetical protein